VFVLLVAPSFVKIVRDKESVAGQTTVLECISSRQVGIGRAARLEWRKDGQPLSLTSRHHFAADAQLLVITATQPSDAGEYTCIITNTLGSERATSRISVVQPNDRSDTKSRHAPDNGSGELVGSREDGSDDDETMRIGVIVIAAIVCVVGTSLVWVLIIYRLRTRRVHKDECTVSGSVHTADESAILAPHTGGGRGGGEPTPSHFHLTRDDLKQTSPLLWTHDGRLRLSFNIRF